MQLQDILYTQGFGTRRVCAGLIQQGLVKVYQADTAEVITDVTTDMEATGLRFQVQGIDWEYHALAYIAFNKPAGTECSQKPSVHPSIYTLLPSPLRLRPQKSAIQGVQAVGRLDQDTTGLLLLSDDGQFIHRMDDDLKPVKAAAAVKVSEHHLQLTLTEGKYHQVKRMLAAVGNRVEGLHRSKIGNFELPVDLLPGQWRWLSTLDLEQVQLKA